MPDYARTLNQAQYEAVTAEEDSVLVVAGAGSGKTRTIVYRLAWLAEHGIMPENILLLTFTRKAANEMLQRASALLDNSLAGVAGGTFHAFAFGALRRFAPAWLGNRPFTLLDASDSMQVIRDCRENLKAGKKDSSFPRTQLIASVLSKARNKELPIEEIIRRDCFHILPHAEELTEIGVEYTRYKREKGLLDYDDLLFELETLLTQDARAAAALRSRHAHILVDEYQDTNLAQARLVRLLAGDPASPAAKVMAVGDEAQSIYAFRGANVGNILRFPEIFPGARLIRLEENYRSTQPILNVANSILEHAAESFDKHLFTRQPGGEPVRYIMPVSDVTQGALVTSRIQELLEKHRPHEIAVLFRSGYHSYILENALRKAGILFKKYGGLRFSEASHIKDMLAYARLVLNPLDLPAFTRIAKMHKGVGPKTVQRLHQALTGGKPLDKTFARFPELREDLEVIDRWRSQKLSPVEFLQRLVEYYRPRLERLYPDDWPSRLGGLEELPQMGVEYDDLDLFVADMALDPAEEEADSENYITLSTVHSAKGLEWTAVLLIDLVEDRFPSRHAQVRPEDYEEERRLFYVACTRARQTLELYAPATVYNRNDGGLMRTAPSPFIRELDPGLVQVMREKYGGLLVPDSCAPQPLPGPLQSPEPVEEDTRLLAAGKQATSDELGYCRHRIFGRGKIVRKIDDEKVQVNFPGFGLKVILTDYLVMEKKVGARTE